MSNFDQHSAAAEAPTPHVKPRQAETFEATLTAKNHPSAQPDVGYKHLTLDFKTQYGLGLSRQDNEIIVDYFCGGGGAGTGPEIGLGRAVTVAKNHSPSAISMHSINHPHAKHFTTDVFEGDPDTECNGRAVGWFHMSPDCTHHSQAAGGQPRKREIRNLSWIGLKWAGKKQPRVISLENVKQILQWGPLVAKRCKSTGRVVKLGGGVAERGEVIPVGEQFLIPNSKRRGQTWKVFVAELQRLGYVVEWRVIKACDFGAPTSRERLFMIARCDGQPIVWPEPTHAKKPAKGQQKWRTAAECIDWSLPSTSIFGRKKGLAPATLRRVAKGIRKFVLNTASPFIVPIANWSGESVQSADEPLRTVTSWPRGGSFAMACPQIAPVNGGEHSKLPADTAHAIGISTALVDQMNGEFNLQLSPEVEAGALRVAAFLISYYGSSDAGDLAAPAPTITTRDRLALVTVTIKGLPYVIVDICLRMLQPAELYKAQGFPPDYNISQGSDGKTFTKTQQVHMCGNSVSPPPMAALARANDPWRTIESLADAA